MNYTFQNISVYLWTPVVISRMNRHSFIPHSKRNSNLHTYVMKNSYALFALKFLLRKEFSHLLNNSVVSTSENKILRGCNFMQNMYKRCNKWFRILKETCDKNSFQKAWNFQYHQFSSAENIDTYYVICIYFLIRTYIQSSAVAVGARVSIQASLSILASMSLGSCERACVQYTPIDAIA